MKGPAGELHIHYRGGLSESDLAWLGERFPEALTNVITQWPDSDLVGLEVLEVTLVDDATIAGIPARAALSHLRRRYHYWFNHAKLSPDGTRFTVKLRFRLRGGGWTESMGVSLTCGMDGTDLALLAPAASHVIWLDDTRLYFWQQGAVRLYEDARPGRELGLIAPGTIDAGYRGEVQVLLVNLGDAPVRIDVGDRIAQLLLQRVGRAEVVEVDDIEDLGRTARGEGGFGSTGVGAS